MAVGVRAALPTGSVATMLAGPTVPGATSSTDRTDTVGSGTALIWLGEEVPEPSSDDDPEWDPHHDFDDGTVVACLATAAASCRRTKPIVFKSSPQYSLLSAGGLAKSATPTCS
jgi:hypothetical protein